MAKDFLLSKSTHLNRNIQRGNSSMGFTPLGKSDKEEDGIVFTECFNTVRESLTARQEF